MNDSAPDTDSNSVAGPALGGLGTSNAHLIALALVAIGTLGALVGLARYQRRPTERPVTTPDTKRQTPPHGDKLLRPNPQ